MSQIVRIVGQRIRSFREQQNLSQESLAEKSGLNHTYIGQLERGEKNASLETLEKLCIALDIPLELLVEHTVVSDTSIIASECYNLVQTQSPANQQRIYDVIKSIVEMIQ